MTYADDHITETTRLWQHTPFAWGAADCVMSVCSYAQGLCGTDPGLPYRGHYANRKEAYHILAKEGGMVPLMAGLLGAVGFRPVWDAMRGDIIVTDLKGEICGLCLGAFATFRVEGKGRLDVSMRALDVRGAWRWEG